MSYSITAGNGDGKFMIDGGTGEITVNAALDYETTDEYRLTVEASDERGGTDTATVTGHCDGRGGGPAASAHRADGEPGGRRILPDVGRP